MSFKSDKILDFFDSELGACVMIVIIATIVLSIGTFGTAALKKSCFCKIKDEREALASTNWKLKDQIVEDLQLQKKLDPPISKRLEELNTALDAAQKDLDALPDSDRHRKERTVVYSQRISPLKDEIYDLRNTILDTHLKKDSSGWPHSLVEYKNNLERIEEIGNLGWPHSSLIFLIVFNLLFFVCILSYFLGCLLTFLAFFYTIFFVFGAIEKGRLIDIVVGASILMLYYIAFKSGNIPIIHQ